MKRAGVSEGAPGHSATRPLFQSRVSATWELCYLGPHFSHAGEQETKAWKFAPLGDPEATPQTYVLLSQIRREFQRVGTITTLIVIIWLIGIKEDMHLMVFQLGKRVKVACMRDSKIKN